MDMDLDVAIDDDLEIRVGTGGGDGPAVLLLHGFSNDRHVWRDVVSELPAGYRTVAPDLRGHGDSGWSIAGDYRPAAIARDLPVLLDALGLERVSVVGHSLGGNVATLFAAEVPARVEALVLVDTGPSLCEDAWRWASGDAAGAARAFDSVDDYRALLALGYPFANEAALDRLARTSLVQRMDGRFEPKMDPLLLERTGSEEDWKDVEAQLWAALASLRCPTLVVRGERSAMFSRDVALEMTGKVLERGTLAAVAGAGHAIPLDAPAALGALVAGFVDEHAMHPRPGAPGVREREETGCRRPPAPRPPGTISPMP